jgi:triose/dihydroxyacetone kinase / FAD-AMP lyase (cyclizing)
VAFNTETSVRSFFNDRADIVNEAIDGLIAASGGRLVRFPRESHARVVLRAGWDKSKVAIVSGGGSGHEPAHAGLVGTGLLTAAVCGDVFASPSVDAVLAAIVAVTGRAGCLLVVKNYTGDRLNFGLAAERAKGLGLKVEMVIVADDVALPDARHPRGVAGTVFVHRIAGHMSEAGRSLDEIAAAAREATSAIFSIGAARDTCTVPGNPRHERIGADQVEIGLGIHGEPGADLTSVGSSRELMQRLADVLLSRTKSGARYAVLINDLGGLSGIECAVLAHDLLQTPLATQIGLIAGPAQVMTALDMPGISISLLELTPEREAILKAPVDVDAFPAFRPVARPTAVVVPVETATHNATPSSDPAVRAVLETIIAAALAMEPDINALDAKVGDGDTGSTLAGAARTMQSHLDGLPFADGAALLTALSELKRRSMGGSSGVLLAIMLARAGEAYREGAGWIGALADGVSAMQIYGGAARGDRTMLDALIPALDALAAGHSVADAAHAARHGANATAAMTRAGAGRSSYLDARSLTGTNDPGAEAVARLFEALVH